VNKILSALAGFSMVLAPSLQAQDLISEPVPAAYFNLSFGSGSKSVSGYGLQLTRVDMRRDQGMNLFSDRHPAYIDVKFQGGEIDAVSFNGSNLLDMAARYGYNADGENKVGEWWQGLSDAEKTGVVIVAIAGIGCVADWCQGGGGGNEEPPREREVRE
jgi:hypothetical protein